MGAAKTAGAESVLTIIYIKMKINMMCANNKHILLILYSIASVLFYTLFGRCGGLASDKFIILIDWYIISYVNYCFKMSHTEMIIFHFAQDTFWVRTSEENIRICIKIFSIHILWEIPSRQAGRHYCGKEAYT